MILNNALSIYDHAVKRPGVTNDAINYLKQCHFHFILIYTTVNNESHERFSEKEKSKLSMFTR